MVDISPLALYITALDQFESKLVKPLQQFIRKGVVTGLGMGVGQFVILAGAGLAYYVGGQLVLMGRATFPQIIAVILRYSNSNPNPNPNLTLS